MNTKLDTYIPGAAGILSIGGIILLSALGRPVPPALTTLSTIFMTWAFGSGVYKAVTTKKDDGGPHAPTQ